MFVCKGLSAIVSDSAGVSVPLLCPWTDEVGFWLMVLLP